MPRTSELLSALILENEDLSMLRKDKDWWTIYKESFPISERDSKEVVFERIRGKVGMAIRARLGERTVGMASLHLLNDPTAIFLISIAISPEKREHRIGSLLFDYAWQSGAATLRQEKREPIGMVWEVEKPDLARNQEERKRRERRIRFYERRGGRILPCDYFLPPLHGTKPIPMHLMFRPARTSDAIDKKTILALVNSMYRQNYHAINKIQFDILMPLFERTLHGTSGAVADRIAHSM